MDEPFHHPERSGHKPKRAIRSCPATFYLLELNEDLAARHTVHCNLLVEGRVGAQVEHPFDGDTVAKV
jgi:hypothetical protein